ncbi:response regulator transcription factor [Tenacibaculum ovolyticum]|uniref:LytR/AlgR family response regulator transcription factor n=1 Tax=Tenacibaculum ovolyticum TaxID=104270 RepID=UPI0007EDE60D|nr:response regulator transcription factor [Tenacibaculum ovolyticum]WBX78208.1 response regulator transcription factor [Tenacibaculum ovolyticum]
MSKIRVLIIEDELSELNKIKRSLEKYNFKIVGTATNLKDALEVYYSINIDVIIIDIFLNNKPEGITFAKTIISKNDKLRPFLFLTSAISKTIFETAKLTNPYSYLLKPFNELELKYSLELAIENFTESINIFKEESSSKYYNQSFFIKKNNMLIKINIKDILYIKVEERYCDIVTVKENFTVQLSLKQFLLKIPSSDFIKVHRNYIINFNKIEKVFLLDNLILLEDNTNITISRQYKQELVNKYEVLS